MGLETTFRERRQVKRFSNKIPKLTDINWLLEVTFKLVPSKQNLLPYNVYVIGPKNKDLKKKFWEITQHKYSHQQDLFAPYMIIFTSRVTSPNQYVKDKLSIGCDFPSIDPKKYSGKNGLIESSLEIGMFSQIFTALAVERKMGTAFFRCFPEWEKGGVYRQRFPFLKDPILFLMLVGYPSDFNIYNPGEDKPEFNEVIKWIEVPSADSSSEQTP